MENLNNSDNAEVNTFFESLNGLTHADASRKISEKMNEVIAEGGEEGLRNSVWDAALTEGHKQANLHSDEIFEYQQPESVKDDE